jgi:hypothetical protein
MLTMHDLKAYSARMRKVAQAMETPTPDFARVPLYKDPAGYSPPGDGDRGHNEGAIWQASLEGRDQQLRALFSNLERAAQADQALFDLLFSTKNRNSRAATLRKVAAHYGVKTADLTDADLVSHMTAVQGEKPFVHPNMLRAGLEREAASHNMPIEQYIQAQHRGQLPGQQRAASMHTLITDPTAPIASTAALDGHAPMPRPATLGKPVPPPLPSRPAPPPPPMSLSSNAGGGTAKVNVVPGGGAPLPQASMPAGVPAFNAPGPVPVPGSATARGMAAPAGLAKKVAPLSLPASMVESRAARAAASAPGALASKIQRMAGKVIHASHYNTLAEQLAAL